MSVNTVTLIGRLVRDVEQGKTPGGITYAHFTLAVNRDMKKESGETVTDFFNITAWRSIAENCAKYLTKGKLCCVIGSLQNRSYETPDGYKRTVTEILANKIEFLSHRTDSPESEPVRSQVSIDELEQVNDELPF